LEKELENEKAKAVEMEVAANTRADVDTNLTSVEREILKFIQME
jgi:hypothetical protein